MILTLTYIVIVSNIFQKITQHNFDYIYHWDWIPFVDISII